MELHRSQDQRPRSTKPLTIHGHAQSGNLVGFRSLLRDNPALLNERNPVMAHTPLHVSAGHNRAEIVKFLLDWPGSVKVELEAKNMYGETPLHMAAKNGCNEAARLLLAHGAYVEAKANVNFLLTSSVNNKNGMTPLHLAVWHALRAEECLTVKTLLEYNADCSAEDNEGMTPINHLSQGPESEKLRELLQWHLKEQRKRRAIEACSETKAKMDELENELTNIVGLHDLKVQLRKWAKGMLLDERRRALGLQVGTRRPPHMAFLGNPGTGKTMVARILGKLLYMVGILPTDKVTEVQRTDLIQEAEGGILFVDEAYRLIPMQKADDKDYGLEALEEIMSVMDSGKIVVIFAGYSEPMKRVIASNEGFCRRVTKFFHFNDFSSKELAEILHIKMNNQAESSLLYGFKLHPSCSIEAVSALIERETTEKQRKEMNGGLVDTMLVNGRENLDLRLSFDCVDTEELLTMTLVDLEAALKLLSQPSYSPEPSLGFVRPLQSYSLHTSLPSNTLTRASSNQVLEDGFGDQFLQNDSFVNFMRFRRGLNGNIGELQTGVVSYKMKVPSSLQVDLVATIHVADKEYFQTLQKELESYDCVLYEMVTSRENLEIGRHPNATKRLKGTRAKGLNIIRCIQRQMARVLVLDYQSDYLSYHADNWYHADLDYETFKFLQAEKGESFFSLAKDMTLQSIKAILQLASFPEDLDSWRSKLLWASHILLMPLVDLRMIGSFCAHVGSQASEYPEIEALSSLDFGAALKILFARSLASEFFRKVVAEVEEGSVIIGDRNRAAMESLTSAIDNGHNRIAILYGGGHMPDLGRRLMEDFNLIPSGVQWITAWSIKKWNLNTLSFPFLKTMATKLSGWPVNRYLTLMLLIFSSVLALDLWFWEFLFGTAVN
ncbi:Protein cfxQ like [Senna tora]|uniref:Protein cfxQ like n=1 Tax=Senna tora TaxID=362788 RepID=A0A834WDZ8_9FABA|nr:Protein cfxQ like [Senna tora]